MCACNRCVDIQAMYRSKSRFVCPLVVIPGPKEPSNISPYVQGILQAFKKYGPGGECSCCVVHQVNFFCLLDTVRLGA